MTAKNDVTCLEHERREVSAAFYMSREFPGHWLFLSTDSRRFPTTNVPSMRSFIPQVQEISRNAIANGVSTKSPPVR